MPAPRRPAPLLVAPLLVALFLCACATEDQDGRDTAALYGADGGDGADGDDAGDGSDGTDGAGGTTCADGLSQGVTGTVEWREGNWMPGAASGEGWPLETAVAAFAPLTTSDVTRADSDPEAYGRYEVGAATPVAQVTSDADGCYALALEPGSYSVLGDDDGAWFCNSTSADGLCVVEVGAGAVTTFPIVIDYRAAY